MSFATKDAHPSTVFPEPVSHVDSTGSATNPELESIKEAVREDILGSEPTGFRKFFYAIDVWPSDQLVRAPKEYSIVNAYFTCLYYLILIAYSAFAIYNFINQVPSEVNSMVSNTDLMPVTVNISMGCNIDYGCGNWTTTAPHQLMNPVKIISNWVATGSDCTRPSSLVITVPNTGPRLHYFTSFQICYSPRISDFVQVQVLYSNNYQTTNPVYNIDIKGDSNLYSNDMFFQVALRPAEWKTIYFSQTNNVNANGVSSYDPYVADLFYNGHSSDSNLAKLTFKLQQFGYKIKKIRTQSIFSTFGNIGGFSMTISGLLGSCKGTIVSFFQIWRVSQRDGGGITNFFTALYSAVLQLFGMRG